MGVFDIVMEKPAEVSRGDGCVWYSHGKTCWSPSKRFPWLYQAHTSSIDFSRFLHDYVKHTHRFDWLQQVFPWLYQTHPSPSLTSADFSTTNKHTHRLDWLQQVFPWLFQAHTSSTDFSRFFHDYVKHTPLQLTSAGFSMTISNTPTSSTDFSRVFHDYIKYTHRLDWLKSVETMGVFDMVMEKPGEISGGDGCVWYSHGKTCWSQSRRWVCLI
jgi:G:T-mismatch repair DNA endonuclease (very short patch repair protein)